MQPDTQTETKGYTEKQKATCYTSKANDSFRTKMKMYLFHKAITQTWDSFSPEDFNSFQIDQELVDRFTTEYWQELHDYTINGLTISQIYKIMEEKGAEHKLLIESLRKEYVLKFNDVYEKDKFYRLLESQKCEYCEITVNDIEQLAINRKLYKKNERGWKLEIDRINSNLEYKPDNCVMACYWCNNAKTDEFTYEEFKEIGKEIRKVWETRLKK